MKATVFEYSEVFDDRRGWHSTFGYTAPVPLLKTLSQPALVVHAQATSPEAMPAKRSSIARFSPTMDN
jgi:hypothetical protein